MIFRRATLPLTQDPSGRFLPWLIAFMVFLACLALASVLAMERVIERWDSGLSGQVTVQVPAADDPALRQQRLDTILDLLQQTPGVRGVALLEEAQVLALVEPWLGDAALVAELPLPDLIAVTLDPLGPPDMTALRTRLAAAVPGTLLDDHQRWLADLMAMAASVEIGALIVVALIGLAAVVTVIFVARTGLEIHRQVIELLHLMGAQDRYIAREFQRHALTLGLRGGIAGYLLAVLVLLGLGWLAGRQELGFLPDVRLEWQDWAVMALLPPLAALVAMWTARRTVLRTLVRMA